jgi:hypothetical protein
MLSTAHVSCCPLPVDRMRPLDDETGGTSDGTGRVASIGDVSSAILFRGAIFRFGLWDNDPFIDILEPGRYIHALVPPGEHIFLARAETCSYGHANLEAGRQYFILATGFPGIWKVRVAYDPIGRDDPQPTQKSRDGCPV